MKRVFLVREGVPPAEAVEVEEVSPLPLAATEVRVSMRLSPINPADLLLIERRHFFHPPLPAPVGIEGAGIVCEAGSLAGIPVGTLVAVPFGGTWSEEMIVPARDAVVLPATIPLPQAAMFCVNPFTAAGLLEGLAPDSWVIHNAANSAVGRLITLVAAQRGINTIAVVRRPEAAADLLAAGAAAVLLEGDDLATEVKTLVGGGVHRALDAVAGEATGRLFRCVGDDGEVVVYGLIAGDQVVLPAAALVFGSVTVRGFSRLRSFHTLSPERRQSITAELVALATAGQLPTQVAALYPLAQVQAAIRHHLQPDRQGKILLRIGDREDA